MLGKVYFLRSWLRNTNNLLFPGPCFPTVPLAWNQILCLFTYGGRLTGNKILHWRGRLRAESCGPIPGGPPGGAAAPERLVKP